MEENKDLEINSIEEICETAIKQLELSDDYIMSSTLYIEAIDKMLLWKSKYYAIKNAMDYQLEQIKDTMNKMNEAFGGSKDNSLISKD